MKSKDALAETISDKAVGQPAKKKMIHKLKCPNCGHVINEDESKESYHEPMDELSE